MHRLLSHVFLYVAGWLLGGAIAAFLHGRRRARANTRAPSPEVDAAARALAEAQRENERLRGELLRTSHELATSRRLSTRLSQALGERRAAAPNPHLTVTLLAPVVGADVPMGAAGPFAIRRGLA